MSSITVRDLFIAPLLQLLTIIRQVCEEEQLKIFLILPQISEQFLRVCDCFSVDIVLEICNAKTNSAFA